MWLCASYQHTITLYPPLRDIYLGRNHVTSEPSLRGTRTARIYHGGMVSTGEAKVNVVAEGPPWAVGESIDIAILIPLALSKSAPFQIPGRVFGARGDKRASFGQKKLELGENFLELGDNSAKIKGKYKFRAHIAGAAAQRSVSAFRFSTKPRMAIAETQHVFAASVRVELS